MSRYVIGDIQGCYRSLQKLLAQIGFQPGQDHLYLLGDLVNRGPDSLSVLEWAMDHSGHIETVLGNHDLHLLALIHESRPLRDKDRSLQTVLESPRVAEFADWLLQQPLLLELDTDWLLVHAGLPACWDASQASRYASAASAAMRANPSDFLTSMYGDEPAVWNLSLGQTERTRYVINALTRMRMCQHDGRLALDFKGALDEAPAELCSWFAVRPRRNLDSRIAFGHWSALGQVAWPEHNVWCLDTGCVWGGPLTAMRLEDQQLFQTRHPDDKPLPID